MSSRFCKGLLPINRLTAWREALAGVMLASMDVPQLLGYARIAGMPPEAGLYTGILPILAFALFGASRHLVVAADSATATIFASKLSKMALPLSAEYMALAGMTALLTGLMLLAARLFRLGFLADFLSRTVLVGFLTGVGIQVGIAMLGDMFGIPATTNVTLHQIYHLITHMDQTNQTTLILSTMVVVAILGGRWLRPQWPMALITVMLSIIVSAASNLATQGVRLIGPVTASLPHLHLFSLSWLQLLELLPVAGSCFVVVISQSVATSRAFAERFHENIDADADLLGLAVANLSAAASGAFVVNGSPTQTAMAERAGAHSQLAQLTFALVVVGIFLFLGHWLSYLPQCVLASVVFTIAIGLVSWSQMAEIRRESPGEFGLALITTLSVLIVGVENGILMAIALSLLRHVRHSYRPHTMVLVPTDKGLELTPFQPGKETAPGLIIYRFGADLFYANEQLFVQEVRQLIAASPHRVQWFIIDAAAIMDLDYSAGRSLIILFKELVEMGINIKLARVSRYLRADLVRHGVATILGTHNLHETLHEALATREPSPDQHFPVLSIHPKEL